MAIGFSSRWRGLAWTFFLAITVTSVHVQGEDQIVKKNGDVMTGQIVDASGGQVTILTRTSNGGSVKLPVFVTDIKTVSMTPPAELAKAQDAEPAVVVATLEPLVRQYEGLPTDWVVDAMAQVAEAYGSLNQADKSTAMYNQIDQFYPGSAYHIQAVSGKAKLSLQQGKVDDALNDIKPLIDEANKNLAPSPAQGRLYASAFLVYGQVLEAQKKPSAALEAYLTVKTMLYQNSALSDQADHLAQNLRTQNPELGVE